MTLWWEGFLQQGTEVYTTKGEMGHCDFIKRKYVSSNSLYKNVGGQGQGPETLALRGEVHGQSG